VFRLRSVTSGIRRRQRPGLAPLELVLSLPLLLMIMAMIIIVGTAGAWKVRTLANSRQAAARSIWPRTGDSDPKPASWWPVTANMSAGSADPEPIDADPFAQHAVVRGPVIGVQGGSSLRVDADLLDATQGLFAGNADVDRALPLWKTLPWRNRYHRETQFYSDNHWQFPLTGLTSNTRRRIDVLYPDYSLAGSSNVGGGRTTAAMQALLANPDRWRLLVLDRDAELRGYYGDPYVSDWYGRYDRFNFHPRPYNECAFDLQSSVDVLTGQIDQAPCNVARAFRQMYQEQINSGNTSPQLQQYVQELDDFLMQHCGN
jgi:hypothetical protein